MPLNDSYESIYERAKTLVSENEWEQAIEEYKRIFNRLGKLSPDTRLKHPGLAELFARTSFELATLLTRMEDYDQAVEVMEQISAYDPDSKPLWSREIARCHIHQGKTEQGLSELEALAGESDDPFTTLALGEAYYHLKNYDRAAEELSKTIQLAQQEHVPEALSLAYTFLFDTNATAGNVEEAVRVWQMSLPLGESLGINLRSVYDLFMDHGDMDGARAVIMQDQSPLRKGLYRGLVSLREGDLGEARRQWEKLARRDVDPESADIDCWMEAGLRVGQADRVIEQAMPVLTEGNINLRTSLILAIAWAMLGETQHADSLLQKMRAAIGWKRDGKLHPMDWMLVDELVEDEEVKEALQHHFAGTKGSAESPDADDVVSSDGESDAAGDPAELAPSKTEV